MEEGRNYMETLVLREEDCAKFKCLEDARLVLQMLMLLGEGMALPIAADLCLA